MEMEIIIMHVAVDLVGWVKGASDLRRFLCLPRFAANRTGFFVILKRLQLQASCSSVIHFLKIAT